MGKNSVRTTPPKNQKVFLAFRIIIAIAFMFVVACTIVYFIELGNDTRSFFSIHFAVPLILVFVGIIAIMLAFLSKQNYSGENKGDKLMVVVGLLLFLFAIITLGMSFL